MDKPSSPVRRSILADTTNSNAPVAAPDDQSSSSAVTISSDAAAIMDKPSSPVRRSILADTTNLNAPAAAGDDQSSPESGSSSAVMTSSDATVATSANDPETGNVSRPRPLRRTTTFRSLRALALSDESGAVQANAGINSSDVQPNNESNNAGVEQNRVENATPDEADTLATLRSEIMAYAMAVRTPSMRFPLRTTRGSRIRNLHAQNTLGTIGEHETLSFDETDGGSPMRASRSLPVITAEYAAQGTHGTGNPQRVPAISLNEIQLLQARAAARNNANVRPGPPQIPQRSRIPTSQFNTRLSSSLPDMSRARPAPRVVNTYQWSPSTAHRSDVQPVPHESRSVSPTDVVASTNSNNVNQTPSQSYAGELRRRQADPHLSPSMHGVTRTENNDGSADQQISANCPGTVPPPSSPVSNTDHPARPSCPIGIDDEHQGNVRSGNEGRGSKGSWVSKVLLGCCGSDMLDED